MMVLSVKRFATIMFCWLTLSPNLTHAMNLAGNHQCPQKPLNVYSFLSSMKTKYSMTAHQVDLIILESVLWQYHPDDQGNILGKNLKRLYRMSQRACQYFGFYQFYRRMLGDISQAIILSSEEDSSGDDDNQTTKCAICLGTLVNPITLEDVCPHNFCYSCLFQWYLCHKIDDKTVVTKFQDRYSCCPLCRSPLPDQVQGMFKNDQAYKQARTQIEKKLSREREQIVTENERAARTMHEADNERVARQIQVAAAYQGWGQDFNYDEHDAFYG